MASADKELEQQLTEAGNKLLDPSSSVDELLALLNQVENCLSRVDQSPTQSMQDALAPSLKALVSDQLFRHSNVDVKVSVASCISEITRITAPDAPYEDDQMKDVFQLIVSSFENLADQSSRSYGKRAAILETVAKVRSCVVMLDLECDALILEMFQHFLKAIRDYHPENVFSSMETIMTLVLEESEDISPELLSPLLASVKKGNEEVLPIAQKLAEKVLESCATKVKPYLIHAVKALGISVDDYSDIVASMCQEMSVSSEENDVQNADENKVEESTPVGASLDEAGQADKEIAAEVASPKQADPGNDTSTKLVVSNGVTQAGEDDALTDSHPLKKQEDGNRTDQSKGVDMLSNAESDIVDAEKVVNIESKPEQATKKKGLKITMKLAEPSESSIIDSEKEAVKLEVDRNHAKDAPSSPCEDQSAEAAAVSSENKRETSSQPSSPKALEGEAATVASPSVSASLPDESLSKKSTRPKKKESLIKNSAPPSDDISKKASEATSDSEAKPHKRSGRKAPAGISNEDKTPVTIDASKKESVTAADSEVKSLKQSSKKVDGDSNKEDGSSLKLSEDRRRRIRGKAIPEKSVTRSSTKDYDKGPSPKSATKSIADEDRLVETPMTNAKRKRAPGKDQASDAKEYGEDLVGSKVKVWWPHDKQFYEGVVDSFDPIKKKHKVVYTDGDEEILNLKRQTWEIIAGDPDADEGEAADNRSPDTSSEMPLKKKVKTNPDQSTKQGKMDASLKKSGGSSSSKSKSAASKSGRKSKEVGKTDGKSVDESKAAKKIGDDNNGKTKDHTSKSGSKPTDGGAKTASKSKHDDAGTSKISKSKEDGTSTPKATKSKHETLKTVKSKQDTEKVTSNAKGKTSKSGSKSNINGSGKLKSGSSKVKETEEKENSTDSGEAQESAKGKLAGSSKGQGSEVKSGKKRRRA